jgi:hypothetical protein
MKAWRILLASILLMGSYFGLFYVGIMGKNPAIQSLSFIAAVVLGIFALTLAQDDGWARRPTAVNKEPEACPDCGFYPGERSIFNKLYAEDKSEGEK